MNPGRDHEMEQWADRLARVEQELEMGTPSNGDRWFALSTERDAIIGAMRRLRAIRERPEGPLVHDHNRDVVAHGHLHWTGPADLGRAPDLTRDAV